MQCKKNVRYVGVGRTQTYALADLLTGIGKPTERPGIHRDDRPAIHNNYLSDFEILSIL